MSARGLLPGMAPRFRGFDGRATRRAALRMAAIVCALLAPMAARAQAPTPAPADTTLDEYIRHMSDSTDAFFRDAVAPPDTAGLDSTLDYMLANPKIIPGGRRGRLEIGPWVRWNRADGPVTGVATSFGTRRRLGELGGRVAWAFGSQDVLGRGEYRKRWADRNTGRAWELTAGGGRETRGFDREHWDEHLSTLRAGVFGNDRHDYARFDGWSTKLEHTSTAWRAALAWRDELESPLPVTATWTLTGQRAKRSDNAVAEFGRARELQGSAGARLGRWPVTVEGSYATAGSATGSDFTYRRTRLAAAGDLSIGGHVAITPQVEYGRLRGEAVPQEAFFLGGASSLRTLDGQALRGTGKALVRVDAILADDILALARIPHPAMLPLQIGAFASSGALWGRTSDGTLAPYRDTAAITSRDWPVRREWLSEAGVSVLYRPGLPSPDFFFRFDYAWPIGGDEREGKFLIALQKAFDLVKKVGE